MTTYVALCELSFGFDYSQSVVLGCVLLVCVVCAFPMIIKGVRGRRVGDHPYCRRCGFDLFGRPANSHICSECGAVLDAPKAIAIGVHQRRAGLLLGGVMLLICSLAIGGVFARDAARFVSKVNWIAWRPDSWLVSEAIGPSATPEAYGELTDRLMKRTLSRRSIEAIVRHGLNDVPVQGQASWRYELPEWNRKFAKSAWDAGQLDDALMKQVLRATLCFSMQAAPLATPELITCPLNFDGEVQLEDVETVSGVHLSIGERIATVNGTQLPPAAVESWHANSGGPGRIPAPLYELSGNRVRLAPHVIITPGQATVVLKFKATLSITHSFRGTLEETMDVVLSGTTQIVPGSQIPKPAANNLSTDAELRFTKVSLVRDGRNDLCLNIFASGGPFLGDVYLVTPGGREKLASIFLWGGASRRIALSEPLPNDLIAVLLEPTPQRRIELFDITTRTSQLPVRIPAWAITGRQSSN